MPIELLLPPSATPLERALNAATARVGDVPAPLSPLWDPATCPAEVLPWLAWGLSVDSWDPDWTLGVKRQAVAGSIDLHRRKGTRAAVETVIARFDAALSLIEWWEASPPATPHTFDVILDVLAASPSHRTGKFAESVIREVTRVKPLREHFRLVQQLRATASVGVAAFARVAGYVRLVGPAQLPGA